jgi:hypothetical protein
MSNFFKIFYLRSFKPKDFRGREGSAFPPPFPLRQLVVVVAGQVVGRAGTPILIPHIDW